MFNLEAPEECKEAGLRDHKECEKLMFKLDAPSECIEAGFDGSGRNDWRKCDKIRFMLDAPEECQKFADDRDPWKKCKPLQFRLDSPQECLDAGLDGSGRDDWRKCDKIRNDNEDQGSQREDCQGNELHICEGGSCYCVSKEEYDKKHEGSGIDCASIYCEQGSKCVDGVGCVYEENEDNLCGGEKCGSNEYCDNGQCRDFEDNECKDGCEDECPGADGTSCVDGNRCECHYNEDPGDGGSPPEEDSPREDEGPVEEPEESNDEPEAPEEE